MTLEEIRAKKIKIQEKRSAIDKKLNGTEKINLEDIKEELRQLDQQEENLNLQEEAYNIANGITEARNLGAVTGIINSGVSTGATGTSTIELRRGQKLKDKIAIKSEERNLSLGKYVRGAVTGKWDGAEAEKRAITTTATGVLIPDVLSAEIIDIARDISLFTLADVPVIPMTEGTMTISRLKKDPKFKFKEEGQQAEESSMELESVKLDTKMCYGYTYVSLEAIKKSRNLEDLIRNAFAEALAQAIDVGMLYGQYNGENAEDFAPKGIMNDETINIITAKEGEGYDSFIKAIGAVRKNNGEASVCGLNADTEEMLSLLKTTEGQYLTPPQAYTDITKIVTNQLKFDETNGSDALVFDPNAMIIGLQEDISFEIFNNTDECIKKGLVGFRIYQMLDCVVTRPKSITKIKGIK